MFEMISFWIYYGVFFIGWYGMLIYWSFPLLDKWVESLTGGDIKNYLTYNYRNPFLSKFSLVAKTDYTGKPCDNGTWRYLFNDDGCWKGNTWQAVVIFFYTLIGAIFLFIGGLSTIFPEQRLPNTHGATVKLATFMTEVATTPLLIVLGLIGLHATLKKVYQFGKRLKPLVDSLNKEEK